MRLIPDNSGVALDIGARDGHFSKLLAEQYDPVIALDLEEPHVDHPRVRCVKGDVTQLEFDDDSFDLVFCTEVLEHIPAHLLKRACHELSRVAKEKVIIGVPYKQDLRIGRTTCYTCGKKNPPWGHVNSFDENRLEELFPLLQVEKLSFVGETDACTNVVSTFLLDLAGNPYGDYAQEESCIYCGNNLKAPPKRSLLQKVLTWFAFYAINIQKLFNRPHPNWLHVLFNKRMA